MPRGGRFTEHRRSEGNWTDRVSDDGLKVAMPVVQQQRPLSNSPECPDRVVTVLVHRVLAWGDAAGGVSEQIDGREAGPMNAK